LATQRKHYCLEKNDEQIEDFFCISGTHRICLSTKDLEEEGKNGSSTLYDFQTCHH
jgi:hypothetical protein